jgi:response regulator RpfG family c-di-GMP phosphodiesterase
MNEDEMNVLYVDDEENNLNSFRASMRRDFKVFTANSADEALKILKVEDIHVLITDQRMPGTLGTELLARVVEEYPEPIRILLTGFSDIQAIQDAVNRGQIYRYLQKPWNEDHLRKTITDANMVYKLRKEQRKLSENLMEVNEKLEFMLRQKLIS